MKKLLVMLCCAAVLLVACGKDESDKKTDTNDSVQVQKVRKKKVSDTVSQEAKADKTAGIDAEKFLKKFNKYDPAQKYYFCAAFAMGAMSVVKPVTASAMVNYFMGLGVAKYNVGINEDTYKAFDAGKNTFRHENLVNTILKRKVCENIMNEAADFARMRNYNIADLDKQGKKEVEKVVRMIKRKKK